MIFTLQQLPLSFQQLEATAPVSAFNVTDDLKMNCYDAPIAKQQYYQSIANEMNILGMGDSYVIIHIDNHSMEIQQHFPEKDRKRGTVWLLIEYLHRLNTYGCLGISATVKYMRKLELWRAKHSQSLLVGMPWLS